MDDIRILKALADSNRIKIINALLKEEHYVESLAEMLGIKPPSVSHHIKKLIEAGIVTSYKNQYYTLFKVNDSILDRSIKSFIHIEETSMSEQQKNLNEYEQKVIGNFFKYGKLKSIPVQLKKKVIILKKMIERFEVDVPYKESEVNEIILDFHEDYCTLRREMVSNKLLRRENGTYWKV